MQRQALAMRHQLRAGPERHASRLIGSLGHALEARRAAVPAGRRMRQLWRLPERLKGSGYGTMNGAVADLLAGQLMGDGLIEQITIGGT
jgi:hypothetical protein